MLRRTPRPARLSLLLAFLVACTGSDDGGRQEDGTSDSAAGVAAVPHVEASSPVEAGRYLVHVAGCNDCHTAGYLQKEGQVPRSRWLAGSRVGFRGPWGTTYANNLRLTVRRVSEDEWVEMLGTRDQKPPMPWFNVHAMSEPDLRAMYRFIRSLGAPGDSVPDPLPPGQQPRTPFYDFVPRKPPGG